MTRTTDGSAATILCAAVVAFSAVGLAAPAVAAEATYHHVHLTASNVPAAIDWYVKNLGGERARLGVFNAARFGKTLILFFQVKPGFEGSVGSSVDHLGFSYPDIAAKMKELEAAGVEIVSGIEQEGPIKYAFVKDPYGTLIEVVEDPEITGYHHAHLATPDPKATLEWYTSTFGGQVSKFAGLIPGIRYGDTWILAKKVDQERAPTKGRAIDHLGWEFDDLDAAAKELEAKGVKFTQKPIRFGTGKIAFIEAPGGVRIELVDLPKQP